MGLALFADVARKLIRKLSPLLPTIERITGALLVVAGLVGQRHPVFILDGVRARSMGSCEIDLEPQKARPTPLLRTSSRRCGRA